MMHFLIGSRALDLWYPGSFAPKDWDYLVSQKILNNTPFVEYFEIPPLYDWLLEHADYFQPALNCWLPSPDVLYTLKVSHCHWNIKWDKHIAHVQFLNARGAKLIPELYEKLIQHWNQVHGEKKINLNVPLEEFFTAYVDRKFNHDQLHEFVAYNEQPIHQKLLVDPNKALLSRKKFEALPFIEKCQLVREETYVIALERFLIPNNLKKGARTSYKKALKLIVTQLTKGWFPLFIIENYETLKEPDVDYVKLLKQKWIF